jgi:methionyl-tRNA synthetase
MKKRFYITTTLPYVNAEPHIGFALEIIEADVQARFNRQSGNEVFFNTGTDEHGLKIFRKAQELGISPQEYVDQQAKHFLDLKKLLNLSFDNFIRTTNVHHIKAAQEFWRRCEANGDIYKKIYKVKYCVGCELEKTESDLVDDKCPIHPNLKLEIIEEENYFFRFSKFQAPLLKLYQKNPDFVVPDFRFNEIKAFVKRGLDDFSVSRLKSKMPWGIEVPSDPEHVIYVWFDALINYVSAAGWPSSLKKFKNWWPVVQLAGKDNLRQQSAMWQAMLMSAKIKPSRQIFINGFINVEGQKMSKSLGNVISPYDMVKKFGADGTRYLLLSFGNYGEDMDVSWKKFTEKYNADLANGLGNLVSRVIKLAQNAKRKTQNSKKIPKSKSNISKLMDKMELGQVLDHIWRIIREDNKYIEDNKPWELAKNDGKNFKKVMKKLLVDLGEISFLLEPFLPEAAEKIQKALKKGKVEPLFQRIK